MTETQFWLNDELVTTDAPAGRLLLDFLRHERRLVGTKEGCKEGDCGACAVLVGQLDDAGHLRYEPVTSCLVPLGEMHGRHVVSIEGINLGPGELSPVQDAVVRYGGSQCGFCTPGFIVSMTWYLMAETDAPTLEGFRHAIGGNLCRCTGYTSLERASAELAEDFAEGGRWAEIWQADDRIVALADAGMLPDYFCEMPARLAELDEPVVTTDGPAPDYFVAGGTDLYVQRGELLPAARIAVLNHYPEMRGISLEDGRFRVGALTTFEEFARDERIARLIPRIVEHMWLIASLPIRNRATLAGNIVNASPIGDMTAMLLALGATLVLRRGDEERRVPMEDFFLGYKDLDKQPGELVTEILFDDALEHTEINFEKISKRKALDIATVCSAARLRADDEGVLQEARISMGGVAPIPLLLRETGEYLRGRTVSEETVRGALDVALSEVSPISDVRGSEAYKRLLTRQLVVAHFVESYPDRIHFEKLAS